MRYHDSSISAKEIIVSSVTMIHSSDCANFRSKSKSDDYEEIIFFIDANRSVFPVVSPAPDYGYREGHRI